MKDPKKRRTTKSGLRASCFFLQLNSPLVKKLRVSWLCSGWPTHVCSFGFSFRVPVSLFSTKAKPTAAAAEGERLNSNFHFEVLGPDRLQSLARESLRVAKTEILSRVAFSQGLRQRKISIFATSIKVFRDAMYDLERTDGAAGAAACCFFFNRLQAVTAISSWLKVSSPSPL